MPANDVARGAPTSSDLGDLPRWRLSDLYRGTESKALKEDIQECGDRARAFRKAHEGRLARMSGAELAKALEDYQDLQEKLGRIMTFAQLTYAGDVADPKIGRFYQAMQETTTEISAHLLFFTLELNRLAENEINSKLKDPGLARFSPWLRDVRSFRAHELDEDLERLLHEKHVTGRSAWVRLFDETMAELRFPFDGKELTSTEILNKLTDRDSKVRQQAAQSFGRKLGENKRLFSLVTNTLAKDKEIEDGWRKYSKPVSRRNLENFVEDEVVEALVKAVRSAYPRLSHRYYALKAKWFGTEKLAYWDRNAPLPDDQDRVIPWSEARDTVLTAYDAFAPKMGEIGRRFFTDSWIDAEVRPGKSPGAFSHPAVPSVHPYILVNYQGKLRDVMTLAHELGHGVHQVLSAGQGYLMADTPLTLAETASVFGEMLTFQSLLASEQDVGKRKVMLASKVEDMLNTVVRQISMHSFEVRVHDERGKGELLPERLGEIWMETQRQSLGPALEFGPEYAHYWAYIPHFIHVPFYVYAYAFGDCLVNSLYAVYRQSEEGFAQAYLEMLSAGGSKRHKELLAPFGLDASDPAFWSKGLEMIAGFIDELEEMG
jgi:oligoendopeptidase F